MCVCVRMCINIYIYYTYTHVRTRTHTPCDFPLCEEHICVPERKPKKKKKKEKKKDISLDQAQTTGSDSLVSHRGDIVKSLCPFNLVIVIINPEHATTNEPRIRPSILRRAEDRNVKRGIRVTSSRPKLIGSRSTPSFSSFMRLRVDSVPT